MRNIYGWSYPAGAENDPNAPYNQYSDPDLYIEDPTAFTSEYCPYCQDRIKWGGDGWHCECGFEQEATDEDYLRARPDNQVNHEKILKAYLDQLSPGRLRALISAYEGVWWAGINGSTADQAAATTALKAAVDSAISMTSTVDLESIETILIQETRD